MVTKKISSSAKKQKISKSNKVSKVKARKQTAVKTVSNRKNKTVLKSVDVKIKQLSNYKKFIKFLLSDDLERELANSES